MSKDEIRNNKLRLLGSLFADLMHEIRNPLSVLKINYELLCEDKDSFSTENVDVLENGKEAIEIIEELISQTMEFIRGNNERFEVCSVNQIAKTVFNFIKNRAKKEGVDFQLNLTENDASIVANKSQIIQVLLNILTNAFDAIGENPKVELKTFCNTNGVFIEINDNGKGMTQPEIEKIFDKYFTTKEKGSGIGLAVVKEILDKHDAEMNINSSPGKGTSFTIKFNNSKELRI